MLRKTKLAEAGSLPLWDGSSGGRPRVHSQLSESLASTSIALLPKTDEGLARVVTKGGTWNWQRPPCTVGECFEPPATFECPALVTINEDYSMDQASSRRPKLSHLVSA